MNYKISSGDCLWNIVKNNYDCKSNQEVSDLVKKIAQDNDLKDANSIVIGNTISLPETDDFVSQSKTQDNDLSLVDKFDEWTNSEENFNKSNSGENVDDFQMFELNLSSYSSDLKDFAQEYLNKYDTNGDGEWNKEEFVSMASANQEISEEFKAEYEALYDQLFSDLNLDDNKDTINAGEFASYLYAADMDWDNYSSTLDVASSIDGKLDYNNYQALSSLEPGSSAHAKLQAEKQDFYNNFYAE